MIYLKSDEEIKLMKVAGRIVAETLQKIEEVIKPGMTTKQLDALAERYIESRGARPSFKGYGGFPASICTSVNEEVVHGIPGDRVLMEGDIVSVDCGAVINGYQGDAARTFPVGQISPEVQNLIDVTRESFFKGIEYAIVGERLGDIGHSIQKYVESNGYSVVRDYVGHGIGRKMHEDPPVPNYGRAGRGLKLEKGLVIAIEPMVNAGGYEVRQLKNGWTVVTKDGMPSAHYENTVAILDNGPELLTYI
jgi:methionyl aminopeptidase